MSIFLTFLFLFLLTLCNEPKSVECKSNRVNVGTVLFSDSDVFKKCWSADNVALLSMRLMMQDLLPDKSVLTLIDDEFLHDLVEYFRLVLSVIGKTTTGKTKHFVLLALTDILGGYLNHIIIPISKYMYYAGYVEYSSMEKLYDLFDEIKGFLRTDGKSWKNPVKAVNRGLYVEPVTIPEVDASMDPCGNLIFINNKVPMPFFDNKKIPTAVAFPFKSVPLRGLEGEDNRYLLIKYFLTVSKCLTYKNTDPGIIKMFQSNYFVWLSRNVLPHFNDEKFYAAFGAVLRIMETLKKLGYDTKQLGNYNLIKNIGHPDHMSKNDDEFVAEIKTKKKNNMLMYILIGLLIAILIWVCLASIFICCRMRRRREKSVVVTSSRTSSKRSKPPTPQRTPPRTPPPKKPENEFTELEFSSMSPNIIASAGNVKLLHSCTGGKLGKFETCRCPDGEGGAVLGENSSKDSLRSVTFANRRDETSGTTSASTSGATNTSSTNKEKQKYFEETDTCECNTDTEAKRNKKSMKDTQALFVSSKFTSKRSKSMGSKKTSSAYNDTTNTTNNANESRSSETSTNLAQDDSRMEYSKGDSSYGGAMTGKYFISAKGKSSSSDKSTSQPAFGYDFETTSSETTPRE